MARKHFWQVIGSAFILSALIINSVFSVSALKNEAPSNWDGTAAAAYAGGTGTEGDPYRITNANELVLMVQNQETMGCYFSIENDIAINDTTDPTWYENADLKNWYSTECKGEFAFWGTIFGNGHTISGLYYKDTEAKDRCVGLIPIAWNTNIYDLTVDDAYLETLGSGVSAFIGFDNYATINIYRCSAGKNVIIKSDAAEKLIAGGFIGTAPTGGNGLKIYDSISAVQFDTIDLSRCGGFIGDCWGSDNEWGKIEIQRSVSAVENVPTVQNYYSWSDFTDTYEIVKGDGYNKVTVLTLEQMQGEAAKENMPGLSWDLWLIRANDYPELKSYRKTADWDGTAAAAYAGGTGTESDPYQITNAGELARMVENKGESGKYFSIENDITINDTSAPQWYENADLKNWYSTECKGEFAFWGTIFGNGHTISGLYYKDTEAKDQCVGLIPIAWNTDIYDLTVDDAYLETVGSGVSAFIGFDNWAAINIYRCSAGKNVIIKSDAAEKLIAGGFIGTAPTGGNGLKIYDSISAVQFDTIDLSRCGGFIGDCWGSNEEWGKIEIQRSVSAVENVPTVQNYYSWSDFTDTYEIVKGDGYNKVTVLTLEQMQGEAAKENMPGLLWDYMWFVQENDYPMVKRVCHETAGDINNDSSVDILDLIKAKKYIVGVAELTGTDYNTADLDRNSDVNSADLIRLRKILLER